MYNVHKMKIQKKFVTLEMTIKGETSPLAKFIVLFPDFSTLLFLKNISKVTNQQRYSTLFMLHC